MCHFNDYLTEFKKHTNREELISAGMLNDAIVDAAMLRLLHKVDTEQEFISIVGSAKPTDKDTGLQRLNVPYQNGGHAGCVLSNGVGGACMQCCTQNPLRNHILHCPIYSARLCRALHSSLHGGCCDG